MKHKKKHRKTHNGIISVFVILFCLAGASGSAYLFYSSLNATLTKTGVSILGKVVMKNNAVQRRFSDRFVWNTLANGSPIYEGDLIRTADLSQASIVMDAGATIDMQENCLIQITKDKWGRLNLQFLGGDIEVKTVQEAMTISQGDKQVRIMANAKVRAVTENTDNAIAVSVESGNAVLQQGDIMQEITQGSALSIDAAGTMREEMPAIKSIPAPVQTQETLEKIEEPVSSPVVFSFLSEATPVSTIKEINLTQASQDNKQENIFTPEPQKAQEPLEPEKPPLLPAPRLLEPGAELDLEAFKKNKNVTFRWTPVSDAKAYIWSLQSGQTQTSVVVRETSFIYDASRIANGTYTWRVEALRTVPATNNVTDRGEAATRQWLINIPVPKKPVLLEPIQD
ncbi:MAG: hypothetical protein LBV52_02185 [Spirochaetaceae bacterium]|jgi:hypothetical protein|nr:hypothetical protein [Spirochaetaceae bacterium]